jgi:hypothetical protein
MLKSKTIHEINSNVEAVVKLFAVRGKYRLIGSSSLRSSQYAVDYDVETHFGGNNPAAALQRAYHLAQNNPNIFVIELKCGIDPRLEYKGDYSAESLKEYLKNPLIPEGARKEIMASSGEEQIKLVRDLYILRWTPKEVAQGKVALIDGTYRTLAEALDDDTVQKIDLIAKVGDEFAEISENYYFKGKNDHPKESQKDLEASLEEDIHYYSKIDSFKALKRLFSLYRIHPTKHKAQMNKLIEFFNGQVGLLNKIKAELGILDTLLNQTFRKVAWIDAYNNLQFIKVQISQVYEVPVAQKVFKQIDQVKKSNIRNLVVTLKDYFSNKVNSESKDFLKNML